LAQGDNIVTATQQDTALPDNSQVSIASDVGPDVADPAYSTDLGMWDDRIADNVREYWIAKDSSQCQHKYHDFLQLQQLTQEKNLLLAVGRNTSAGGRRRQDK